MSELLDRAPRTIAEVERDMAATRISDPHISFRLDVRRNHWCRGPAVVDHAKLAEKGIW